MRYQKGKMVFFAQFRFYVIHWTEPCFLPGVLWVYAGVKLTTPLKPQSASILLFGQDKRLVETRSWVLEKEGFRIHTALSLTELSSVGKQEPVELFLLCDSLKPEARSSALELIQSEWPGAKRLVLMPCSVGPAEFDPPEQVFPAMEGPSKLVATIRTLIVNAPASAV